MANYATLKAAIQQVITANANNEITGTILQQTLLSMITSLGEGFQFIGIATPETTPGTPDQKVFYIGAAGTYPNFGPTTIQEGYLGIFKYSDNWSIETIFAGKNYDNIYRILGGVIDYTITQSPNLFNKDTAETGKAVSQTTGIVFTSNDMSVSDFIPIPAGATSLYLTHLRVYGVAGAAIYDSSKTYKRGAGTNLITLESGDAYIRFSMLTSNLDVAMVIAGTQSDVPSSYVPYGELVFGELKSGIVTTSKLADGAVTPEKIADDAITSDKVANGAITEEKTSFFVTIRHESNNLLNPAECVYGYVNYNNGNIGSAGTSRYATGYIPVDSRGLKLNCYSGYGSLGSWAIYDANKNFVRGGYSNPQSGYVFQAGDVYIRITIAPGGVGTSAYIVRGDAAAEYTPYFDPYNTYELSPDLGFSPETKFPRYEPAVSLAGESGTKKQGSSLSNNTITLDDCPQYLKRQFNLSFDGKISAFSTLDIGVGQNAFNGTFIRIDSTNINLYRFTDTEQLSQTQAHGLTIANYLNVSVYMEDGEISVRIGSISGIFEHTFTPLSVVDSYGLPFVSVPSGTTVINYSFRYAGVNFRRPIWVVGDSYVTWYPQRWPVQLWNTFGVKNFLLDGLAGGHSGVLYAELLKMLNFGTPKFLIWCLGMNDSYNEWVSTFESLKVLCEQKGITLILQTIPWPQDWENNGKPEINAEIISSGYRYLDGYAAVSSDNNGTWYTDFCQDGIHPTVKGAEAMASRFLSDFPEFLQ